MAVSLSDIFKASPKTSEAKKSSLPIIAESGNPGRDFVEDLVSWLEHSKTDKERAPGLHCSSLWTTCPREPLLSKLFEAELEKKPKTAGQIMTLDVGSALHDLIQNAYCGPWGRLVGNWKCMHCQEIVAEGTMPQSCPKCGLPWRNEQDGTLNIVYVEMFLQDKDLGYCGHCDGVVLDRTLTKKRLLEFKSISKYQYDGLTQPKTAHIIQTHAYMRLLGLKEAFVVYLDKGSQCDWSRSSDGLFVSGRVHIKTYLVTFSDDVWNPMEARIKDYHTAKNMVSSLPVVTKEDVMKFNRVCSHKGCDLASECGVRNVCFGLPK